MASITLNSLAEANPLQYKPSIYIEFGMIGACIIIFILLPESPCQSPF